jgi:acyl-coenzyme A thioesterase PaaI-like protein
MSRVRARDGEARVDVPDDWLQGRTLFGGLQAAIALAAMRSLVPAAPLRSLQVSFIAPVPGGPVGAKARVLRSGKNVTFVESRIVEGDEVRCMAVGAFGGRRDSVVALAPRQPAAATAGFEVPYEPGRRPAFTQHFLPRYIEGGIPYSGNGVSRQVIGLAMRDSGMATEAHVVAMADFIPPIALSYLSQPAPAASLTWMLELLAEDFGALPLEGWRVDAELSAAAGGYTHQSLVLWGPGGVPVALGRQSMVVFG